MRVRSHDSTSTQMAHEPAASVVVTAVRDTPCASLKSWMPWNVPGLKPYCKAVLYWLYLVELD